MKFLRLSALAALLGMGMLVQVGCEPAAELPSEAPAEAPDDLMEDMEIPEVEE